MKEKQLNAEEYLAGYNIRAAERIVERLLKNKKGVIPFILRTNDLGVWNQWYNEYYLRSDWWKLIKNIALYDAGGKCVNCGSAFELQGHHISYDNLGTSEEKNDIRILCEKCHAIEHGVELNTMELCDDY